MWNLRIAENEFGIQPFSFCRIGFSFLIPPVPFQKITIIGVGLLGGSLGLAIKQRRLADEVTGYVRRAGSITECRNLGAVDVCTRDIADAVAGADLIVLCTPLSQMAALVSKMLPALKPGAIVTDVGSVKGTVVTELERTLQKAGVHFIGSHPMAGAEKTGVSAARANLFLNSICVVTPTKKTNRAALHKVEQFWKAVGGRVVRLSPRDHDALVARSSHLPHLTAAALANLVLNPKLPKKQSTLCATGFRDTTRIASGSPEMWRDIALANRKNLASAVDLLIRDLQKLQRALKKPDEQAIIRFLENAKTRRDAWCARCASPSPE